MLWQRAWHAFELTHMQLWFMEDIIASTETGYGGATPPFIHRQAVTHIRAYLRATLSGCMPRFFTSAKSSWRLEATTSICEEVKTMNFIFGSRNDFESRRTHRQLQNTDGMAATCPGIQRRCWRQFSRSTTSTAQIMDLGWTSGSRAGATGMTGTPMAKEECGNQNSRSLQGLSPVVSEPKGF